jgi:hypothetical protein
MRRLAWLLFALAPGCVLANDYGIFGGEADAAAGFDAGRFDAGALSDAGRPFDAGVDAQPIGCASPEECGDGETCSANVCISCDADGDGFEGALDGCDASDCDDTDAGAFPGALPACGDGTTQSCSFFTGAPFGEIGLGPVLELAAVGPPTAGGRSLSVLYRPPASISVGGGVMAIVHEQTGTTPTARVVGFDAAGAVSTNDDLRPHIAAFGMLPAALSGSQLRRVEGRVLLGLTGDCCGAVGRAFLDLDTPRMISASQRPFGKADYRAQNAVFGTAIEPRHGYIVWGDTFGAATVYLRTIEPMVISGRDPRLDGTIPQWLVGDGRLAFGRHDAGLFMLGTEDAGGNVYDVALPSSPERGALALLDGTRFVGAVPGATAFTTFTLDCPSGAAQACVSGVVPSAQPFGGRRHFAMTAVDSTIAALAFADGDAVRVGFLQRDGVWLGGSVETIFEDVTVEDVAITIEPSLSGARMMVAAVVGGASGSRLIAREIVACAVP